MIWEVNQYPAVWWRTKRTARVAALLKEVSASDKSVEGVLLIVLAVSNAFRQFPKYTSTNDISARSLIAMSSNSHQALKDVRKAGTARTDQDQTFKKPFQAVDHLPTVHHNMHDDFVRDPPKVPLSDTS